MRKGGKNFHDHRHGFFGIDTVSFLVGLTQAGIAASRILAVRSWPFGLGAIVLLQKDSSAYFQPGHQYQQPW